MSETARSKICIVTADIVGPIRNGGIGTWYHALALALAEDGHQVTILYTLGDYCENQTLEHWKEYYAGRGIHFIPHARYQKAICDAALWVRISFEVCEWLRDKEVAGDGFDIVHFHEWRGNGFYPVLAKRQGLAFARTVLCVGTHSPLLWHKFGSAEFIGELEELQTDYLERQSVELCDVVVSPSRYMLEWIRSQGWILPRQVEIRQYIQSHFVPVDSTDYSRRTINEIVFFGRLETRKGISLFCEAMDVIGRNMPEQPFSVIFLGKRSKINGVDSGDFLDKRCVYWPFAWRMVDTLDHAGAIDFLRQPGRMAVIASLLENSPNTVLECLVNQVPCLCTDIGGNSELIAEPDRQRTTFAPRDVALADKLKIALSDGFVPARPAILPEETRREWLSWHRQIIHRIEPPRAKETGQPLVSVCLVHHNRPHLLRQAVESLRLQDYPHIETVLVDDGSTSPQAIELLGELEGDFARRGWKIIRQANAYLGAARNRAARESRGEFLLFMDDDNVAKPDEVSTFVRAAQYSGSDVLTCVLDTLHGDDPPIPYNPETHRWLPIGAAPSVGIFTNLIGDANALFRKTSFEALGGFTEDYGIGHEDWELFCKAMLRGFVVQVVPQSLFWYRVGSGSMLRLTNRFANHMRSLRPYLEAFPALRTAIEYSQSLFMLLAQRTADASTLYDRVLARQAELDARNAELERKRIETEQIKAEASVAEQRVEALARESLDTQQALATVVSEREKALAELLASRVTAEKYLARVQTAETRARSFESALQHAQRLVNEAQGRAARAESEAVAANNEAERIRTELSAQCELHGNGGLDQYQTVVDDYWNSFSWRASKPFRKMLSGGAAADPPRVHSRKEAEQIVDSIRTSASWELMGWMRVVGKLFKPRR